VGAQPRVRGAPRVEVRAEAQDHADGPGESHHGVDERLADTRVAALVEPLELVHHQHRSPVRRLRQVDDVDVREGGREIPCRVRARRHEDHPAAPAHDAVREGGHQPGAQQRRLAGAGHPDDERDVRRSRPRGRQPGDQVRRDVVAPLEARRVREVAGGQSGVRARQVRRSPVARPVRRRLAGRRLVAAVRHALPPDLEQDQVHALARPLGLDEEILEPLTRGPEQRPRVGQQVRVLPVGHQELPLELPAQEIGVVGGPAGAPDPVVGADDHLRQQVAPDPTDLADRGGDGRLHARPARRQERRGHRDADRRGHRCRGCRLGGRPRPALHVRLPRQVCHCRGTSAPVRDVRWNARHPDGFGIVTACPSRAPRHRSGLPSSPATASVRRSSPRA
jgi:hypothetical protein